MKFIIREIFSQMIDNKQTLKYYFTQFKFLDHESLDVFNNNRDEIVRLSDKIYNILSFMSNYLILFFDYINNIIDIVFFKAILL